MPEKTITVISCRPYKEGGKVGELVFSIDGKQGEFKFKCFVSEAPAPGTSVTVNLIKKPPYSGNGPEEDWVEFPKTRGGGFGGRGGPGKADPEKLKIEQSRLDLEGQKQSYIIAQVIVKEAVALAIAQGNPDANTVQGYADDLGDIYANTLKRTAQTLAANQIGGK